MAPSLTEMRYAGASIAEAKRMAGTYPPGSIQPPNYPRGGPVQPPYQHPHAPGPKKTPTWQVAVAIGVFLLLVVAVLSDDDEAADDQDENVVAGLAQQSDAHGDDEHPDVGGGESAHRARHRATCDASTDPAEIANALGGKPDADGKACIAGKRDACKRVQDRLKIDDLCMAVFLVGDEVDSVEEVTPLGDCVVEEVSGELGLECKIGFRLKAGLPFEDFYRAWEKLRDADLWGMKYTDANGIPLADLSTGISGPSPDDDLVKVRITSPYLVTAMSEGCRGVRIVMGKAPPVTIESLADAAVSARALEEALDGKVWALLPSNTKDCDGRKLAVPDSEFGNPNADEFDVRDAQRKRDEIASGLRGRLVLFQGTGSFGEDISVDHEFDATFSEYDFDRGRYILTIAASEISKWPIGERAPDVGGRRVSDEYMEKTGVEIGGEEVRLRRTHHETIYDNNSRIEIPVDVPEAQAKALKGQPTRIAVVLKFDGMDIQKKCKRVCVNAFGGTDCFKENVGFGDHYLAETFAWEVKVGDEIVGSKMPGE